ncbi:DNA (cytosine-5-)-methyltransferase [Photobacterium damselae]|uniref:DNA (Cytosine-5-)-methyltransferase n=3 Tax=Photobacterium damselae TaxID=38293 RepID=A0ACD3SXI9_PHODM|nr:DNA cytosine methyltransferase [Photobacterium damselae]RDL28811.1 DNA (cytosine-5-)-methyltransferase [Photobacterium damselae]TMX45747.1 DNA (cytosine-5-)-methyltransferase [Photobacterium damselae]TMX62187.1 DNA (cytosine-5-)-methyltransferase [Photobacterium damselae]TMX73274.1 DNA (cytosine-5-)-methyltransferase [Photobacterium damselae]TMX73344.1 DNA (cytosine-5-)-methyltransferase [Photobacterium damselae]
MKIKAVDLFCGAGGLTHGLSLAGIEVVAGYDIDHTCKYAYSTNNSATFYHKDVTKVTSDEILEHFKDADLTLLAGCAPCQPFSRYQGGKDTTKDKKWPLLYEFSRLIKQTKPNIVTMENVPDVVRHAVYDDFINELEEQGYYIWASKVYCPDYGMPQIRKRHVLIASLDKEISLIPATHQKDNYVTVRDAIEHLPPIKAGEINNKDPLHKSPNLSPLNLKRIQHSKPGGTWKDWPEELRANCHKKDSGSNYTGVYARMNWDTPSPSMTTQCYGYGNGRFGHPIQDRAISLREAAIFQTFPPDYIFVADGKDFKFKDLGRMIGNAVPVRLGEIIGQSIIKNYI